MHIILYVLDALRADHLGCYGYERDVSPQIDSIAREGVVFENCFTSSTWTRPVAASILTGAYPAVHMTRSRQDRFSTPLARLPEILRNGKYKTAAFSTMGNLAGEMGFDRGFDVYHDLFLDPTIIARRSKRRKVDDDLLYLLGDRSAQVALPYAEDINGFLLPWLTKNMAADTFSFVWSIETHPPFIPPVEYRRFSPASSTRPDEGWPEDIRKSGLKDCQRLMDLYDDELGYNDHCIGEIVAHLKACGIYDKTMIVIMSDHGESFFEHGTYGHGYLPYEELIHVPLIIKFPGAQHAGHRAKELVELIDILPTVTAAAGLTWRPDPPFVIQGRNLLPLLGKEVNCVHEYVFSDTHSPSTYNSDRYFSVRNSEWKYIQIESGNESHKLKSTVRRLFRGDLTLSFKAFRRHFRRNYGTRPREYLFNLNVDPGEKNNLAGESPQRIEQFREMVENHKSENATHAAKLETGLRNFEESETLRRHLEDLGYM